MEKHTFIKLMTDELRGKGLTLFEKAVYSSLYGKYQYYNAAFYTYEKYIAEELEISEKTVMRAITRLQELNLINVKRRYNKETKKVVNYYTVNEPEATTTEEVKKEEIVQVSMDNVKVAQNEEKQASLTSSEKNEIEKFKNYVEETNKKLGIPKIEDLKITKENPFTLNPNYNKIVIAIEENFNTEPELYLKNINKLYDIQYSTLEELARLSHTNPQIALDFIKEIRHIETTY